MDEGHDVSKKVKQSTYANMALCVQLMEHLVTPAFVLDCEGRVIIWNKACEALTGLPTDEILGSNQHWKAFYLEERLCLADVVLHQMQTIPDNLYESYNLIQGGAKAIHAENWCFLPRRQEKRYIAFDAGAVFDESGKLSAVVETLTDMTELKLIHSELEQLATKDPLTGMLNRRALEEHMNSLWSVLKEQSEPFSVMMIDIDHFKLFNDTYGHQEGDDCLQRVAKAISSCLSRLSDKVYRYGGEEFAVLLPATNDSGAMLVADRINRAVKNLKILHTTSTTSDILTVSIGIAVVMPSLPNQTASDAIALADAALYKSKHKGRDTYTLFRSKE